MVQFTIKLLRILLFWACSAAHATGDIQEFESHLAAKRCDAAKKYARLNFSMPQRDTLTGIVFSQCFNDDSRALIYFSNAANHGDIHAKKLMENIILQSKNIKPDLTPKISSSPSINIPAPPAHVFTPSVEPRIQVAPAYAPVICHQMSAGIGVPPMIVCN
jgi:hypothetical protein